VGGSAVHETTEIYDLWTIASDGNSAYPAKTLRQIWDFQFNAQLGKAFEKEPNENKWGRSQSEPIEVWRSQGLQFVQSYIDWRERSPWEIWTTPEGEPAIELDISGRLPGCPVEIKAYLDRVFYDPVFNKHWIVDLKSGKRPPKSPEQFGTYRALTKVKYGIDISDGAPFMNRRGGLGKPYDLSEYTPEAVGAAYGKAWEQVQEYARTGSWPANTGDCFICDVQASCAAVGGPLAPQYDPAAKVPF
jgi:putative RecB family exonuclease